MDWRAWWATVHRASKSQPQLSVRACTHTHTHCESGLCSSNLDYVQSLFESQFSYLENEDNNYSNEKMYGKLLEQCLVCSKRSMCDS